VSRTPSLSAHLARFDSAAGRHLFFVAGSRIFDVDDATADAVGAALRLDDATLLPAEVHALLDNRPGQPAPLVRSTAPRAGA